MAFNTIQGGGGLGERDDVQVAIVVVVQNGRKVDAQTNHRQVAGLRPEKVERCSQRERRGVKGRASPGLGGVGVDADAVLEAGEDVGLAVAIVIPQEAPCLLYTSPSPRD